MLFTDREKPAHVQRGREKERERERERERVRDIETERGRERKCKFEASDYNDHQLSKAKLSFSRCQSLSSPEGTGFVIFFHIQKVRKLLDGAGACGDDTK